MEHIHEKKRICVAVSLLYLSSKHLNVGPGVILVPIVCDFALVCVKDVHTQYRGTARQMPLFCNRFATSYSTTQLSAGRLQTCWFWATWEFDDVMVKASLFTQAIYVSDSHAH